ncbi:hypothetical protein [Microbacterium sp. BH-3-3-3]|uniref:hypothetical protein n=1 Tax=Microbacterium sp. BH-3-3-3 TaxID=1906742 RepID=UPI00119FF9A8|nr:hypothetical protein [Microbacterium sp. BH-3-3-3]
MSLTSHLKDTDSSVREFVYSSAPTLATAGTRGDIGKVNATRFDFDTLTALATLIPIPAEVKPPQRKGHAIVAGMALDYRLRMNLPGFDVAATTAWRGLKRLQANPDVIHRGKHIAGLLQDALDFAYLTLKEKDPHPLSLARLSIPLAWCEAIYRAGPVTALANNLGRRIKRAKDGVELIMGIDENLLFDVARMHKPLVPLLDEWKGSAIPVVSNPTFMGSLAVGGADADFIVGDLLVEIKTREQITSPWIRDTLFQLLGYTLLDVDDAHGIRRVGLLLPRQLHLQIWSLDELLGSDAEEALPEIRNKFAGLLTQILAGRLGVDLDDIDDDRDPERE